MSGNYGSMGTDTGTTACSNSPSWQASYTQLECNLCSKRIENSADLSYHYAHRHSYCVRCYTGFDDYVDIIKHIETSPVHHICQPCRRDFSSLNGLKEHFVQSPYHSYCQYCDEHFKESKNLQDHYEESHYCCFQCNSVYDSELGLKEHYRQSPAHVQCKLCYEGFQDFDELDEHNKQSHARLYCSECRTHYRSEQNLEAHLKSSVHQPKMVACPAELCRRAFTSRSALISHLESSSCGLEINRVKSGRTMSHLDQDYSTVFHGRNRTFATERSWNGYAYECFLCHDVYLSLQELNNHLASPTHQTKLICPGVSCRTRFTTLGSLVQHIESESCGIGRFQPIHEMLDKLMKLRTSS